MKEITQGWTINLDMKVDGKESVLPIRADNEKGSKDIFKDFEKHAFFSYRLDTGFCMKKINSYNWQLQWKPMSAKITSALGPVRLPFPTNICQKRVLAKDLKEFECIPPSVSKKNVSWQNVYGICLNRE